MNKFEKLIEDKAIEEILHFTTNLGLLGTFRTEGLLPNSELKKEDTLAFIFKQNSLKRKEWDLKWLNYVNLSVTKLNFEFFNYSRNVHQGSDIFWAILSFSPQILLDPGVYFTTTNNIYPSCIRGEGMENFERMFSNPITGKYQKKIYRGSSHIPSWTTCEQAEVLYPGKLSLTHLKKIYVSNFEDKASVMAQLTMLDLALNVEVCPNKFRDNTNDN